ncbi:MAG: hypothetical protein KKH68_04350 [Proteobacteria bacterium]|nr:hypothetical protein [Pseudomonadota bacterium]
MLYFIHKLNFQPDRKIILTRLQRCYIPVIFMLVFMQIVFGISARAADKHAQNSVNCDIHSGACTQTLADTGIKLDISPKPVRAMQDLRFQVTLSGRQPAEEPYIDLGMPGMKMGPNRVVLKPLGDGVFEGTGVIVRCPSGKKIWKAAVTLPDMGTVEFVFDVIY